jgi:hypothetical protein
MLQYNKITTMFINRIIDSCVHLFGKKYHINLKTHDVNMMCFDDTLNISLNLLFDKVIKIFIIEV